MKNTLLTLIIFSGIILTTSAQKPEERSVQMSSFHDIQTNELVLQWRPSPQATVYSLAEWVDNKWSGIATLGDSINEYRLPNYEEGVKREFRILKFGGLQGYGYIEVGRKLPLIERRGGCLLVVDGLLLAPLESEIKTWVDDIEADGWKVTMIGVDQQMNPQDLKLKINEWNGRLQGGQATVFLLGHVPVAYSGLIAPDGHGDHIGAWPCDAYYADMDGIWSDNTANNTSASDPRNKNIPGDGKFDQNIIPSPVELEIGRADFFNLPAFSKDYIELTREYLNKNHAFRIAQFRVKRRGLIEDNFSSFDEGFSQNGWKNFSATVGSDSIDKKDYETTLESEDYLWAYACGGGSYTSMSGVGNTTNLYVNRDIKAVFVMNFGSYFGDWDKTDNFLRAALASGTVLTNAWAGRPNWQFHPMASGQTIGYCTRLSQNNSNQYTPGNSGRSVHIGLMGDPTLRMHPIAPPEIITAQELNAKVELNWTSKDDRVESYVVYRRAEGDEDFDNLSGMITDTFFIDSIIAGLTTYEYMIKAIVLESTPSGSYYNSSIGTRVLVETINGCTPMAAFEIQHYLDKVDLKNLSQRGMNYNWRFSDGTMSAEENPSHIFQTEGDVEICLIVENDCGSDQTCQTINIVSSLPDSISIDIEHSLCNGDSTGSMTVVHSGNKPKLDFLWSNGQVDSSISNLKAGLYELKITSITGRESLFGPLSLLEPDEIIADIMTTPSSGQNGTATADVTGGTPPYTLIWGDGTLDPQNLPPGRYNLTVVDSNKCESVFPFEVKMNTSVLDNTRSKLTLAPNPSNDYIEITLENADFSVIEVNWIDISGRLCSIPYSRIDGSSYSVDLTQLVPGFYTLKVTTEQHGIMMAGVIVTE